MAGLKILWTPEAVRQLHLIFEFYNVRNGTKVYSKRLHGMIKDTLRLVASYPYMYPKTTYHDKRYFACEYFKVFYSVHPQAVIVEAIFDTRRNPDKNPFI